MSAEPKSSGLGILAQAAVRVLEDASLYDMPGERSFKWAMESVLRGGDGRTPPCPDPDLIKPLLLAAKIAVEKGQVDALADALRVYEVNCGLVGAS